MLRRWFLARLVLVVERLRCRDSQIAREVADDRGGRGDGFFAFDAPYEVCHVSIPFNRDGVSERDDESPQRYQQNHVNSNPAFVNSSATVPIASAFR